MHLPEIKKVLSTELLQLQSISRLTFYETFAKQNTPDNIQNYLDTNLSTEKLSEELNHPDSEFYFALLYEQVIGYLKLNFAQAQNELKANTSLEIERIYVLSSFQGKNIGQTLFQKALSIASQKGLEYIWLGVWENNKKAIEFYLKNGFEEFDRHIFKLGNDEQTDIMMRLKIKPKADK
ncbi:MAG: GNAT family N-acetyltransferase [Bacteroidia bacterium]|nr:GNAT family N-acetyltransferase [Bacteroidia bacterium]